MVSRTRPRRGNSYRAAPGPRPIWRPRLPWPAGLAAALVACLWGLVAALTFLAVATFDAADPCVNVAHSTARSAGNLVGRWGAVWADLLRQGIGLLAWGVGPWLAYVGLLGRPSAGRARPMGPLALARLALALPAAAWVLERLAPPAPVAGPWGGLLGWAVARLAAALLPAPLLWPAAALALALAACPWPRPGRVLAPAWGSAPGGPGSG